jgi:hypothetical protein
VYDLGIVCAPVREIGATIENATTWSIRGAGGLPPHGRLWRAAVALDEFSQATVASAGVLAQANAVRFGRYNQADVAFVAPVLPELPAERGRLADFAKPLRGRLRVDLVAKTAATENTSDYGGAIPHAAWPHRLGPWARLFPRPGWYPYYGHRGRLGWRHDWGVRVPTGPARSRQVHIRRSPREGKRITGPTAGGGRAGHAASRGQGWRRGVDKVVTRTWQPTKFMPRGYTTYGPYYWMRRWMQGYIGEDLPDARYREYYDKILDTKLKYMFGPVHPPLEVMHQPMWWTDLDQAREIGEDPDSRCNVTKYYYIEVIYRLQGTQRSITSHNLDSPVAQEYAGWVAPEDLHRKAFKSDPEVTFVGRLGALPMWKFTAEGHETTFSPEGEVTGEYTVQFEWYFIFGGLDAGGDVAIRNPCNWDELDGVPAPTMLTEAARLAYDPDPNAPPRFQTYSMLGVARRQTHAPFWRRRFANDNPLGAIVTVAQAKIFNNTSWDLWTQDWQAQLNTVSDWAYWADELGTRGVYQAPLTNGMVFANDVQEIADYMWNLAHYEMTDTYLTH